MCVELIQSYSSCDVERKVRKRECDEGDEVKRLRAEFKLPKDTLVFK